MQDVIPFVRFPYNVSVVVGAVPHVSRTRVSVLQHQFIRTITGIVALVVMHVLGFCVDVGTAGTMTVTVIVEHVMEAVKYVVSYLWGSSVSYCSCCH